MHSSLRCPGKDDLLLASWCIATLHTRRPHVLARVLTSARPMRMERKMRTCSQAWLGEATAT
eukprot:4434417-Alexandrium_andersonii.AAC.1